MHQTPSGYSYAFWFAGAVVLSSVVSITASAQNSGPVSRGQETGTPASVSGVLTVIVGDDFGRNRSELVHMIRDERSGRTFRVRFEGVPPQGLRSGARVTARGRQQASEIFVAAADGTGLTIQTTGTTSAAAALPTEHRTIVIVANFRDANVTCTMQSIGDMMFTDPNGRSAAALYRECSLGQVLLSGDVVGPYTLNAASTDPCDFNRWSVDADAQATAAGVNVGSYQHKFYVFPVSQCGAAGYGTIGGNPSSAWVFQCGIRGVYAHEFGHNLALEHASTPTSEYDDSTDPMAMSTGLLPGLNAPHRHQRGWYGASGVRLVEQEGLYDVAPLALDPALTTAPQMLMIRKPDTGEYYYLSYRWPMGFDALIDGSFFYRLSVHRYRGDGTSARTFRLAGLADGESFVDQANGISVTMVNHDSTHASVSVSFACAAAAPSVTLSPQSQSAVAGASASYAVTISNRDSVSCAESYFTLNRVVPDGWTATMSPANLAVAAGASAQATLSVTSPTAASAGVNSLSVNVSDAQQPAHAASASATFTVVQPTDTTAPTAPTGTAASPNQKLKQIRVSWGPASDNVRVAGYRVWKDGVVVASSATTSWSDSAVTTGRQYTYAVEAYDAAGNRSALSNSATASLSNKRR